jgi:2-C-methyl-D-erythritol 4-phosphate cytidylyltransferase
MAQLYNTMNEFCVIVAGGLGTRMRTEIPKQYLLLGGKPLLMYSLSAFRQAYHNIVIILVLPDGQQEAWMNLCKEYRFNEPHTLVTGGKSRFHSVQNGLSVLNGNGLVAIHDGVRPLILPGTIRHLFSEAAIHSNAVPTISSNDSLRWSDDQGNRVIERNHVKLIQTPQVFLLNKLRSAYVQEYADAFTDDATVWEQAGNTVHLTEGQESNIKITKKEDLAVAEALLRGA